MTLSSRASVSRRSLPRPRATGRCMWAYHPCSSDFRREVTPARLERRRSTSRNRERRGEHRFKPQAAPSSCQLHPPSAEIGPNARPGPYQPEPGLDPVSRPHPIASRSFAPRSQRGWWSERARQRHPRLCHPCSPKGDGTANASAESWSVRRPRRRRRGPLRRAERAVVDPLADARLWSSGRRRRGRERGPAPWRARSAGWASSRRSADETRATG